MTKIAAGSNWMGVTAVDQEKRWFVGVGWASRAHQVGLTDASGSKVGERMFEHGGAGLRELAA